MAPYQFVLVSLIELGVRIVHSYRREEILIAQFPRASMSAGPPCRSPCRHPESKSLSGFEERGDSWDEAQTAVGDPVTSGPTQTKQYLSTTQEDVTKHKLPLVFYFRDTLGRRGSKFEAYVEYILEATLGCPGITGVKSTFPMLTPTSFSRKPRK
ncbi:hypothetical protein BJ170DRAFT_737552 [Xylariales sp. AK1849]|nr:hypothetical protein BJ170DRAFT_737552 [Xylariales sp. AK1849]